MAAEATRNNVCQQHVQFEKRLDERMSTHMQNHVQEKDMLCRKLDDISKEVFEAHNDIKKTNDRIDKLVPKIYWMLGLAGAIAFAIEMVVMLFGGGHK